MTGLEALKETFQWWQTKTDSLLLVLDSNRHNFQVVYVCSPVPTPLTMVTGLGTRLAYKTSTHD